MDLVCLYVLFSGLAPLNFRNTKFLQATGQQVCNKNPEWPISVYFPEKNMYDYGGNKFPIMSGNLTI